METAEQNTSKQVSAEETALRNVYNYSRIKFFFFFFEAEWMWRNRVAEMKFRAIMVLV